MHGSSLYKMKMFRQQHLAEFAGKPLKILDLGSTEIGASYRTIFDDPAWTYTGADLQPGLNVDVVLKAPYHWREIPTGSIDLFISGQVFEHVEYFWLTLLEMSRVLKPGGLVCIIVPSSGPEHRFPVDCWRFYPDGARAMGKFAGMEILKAETHWGGDDPTDDSMVWQDTTLVCRKPVLSSWAALRRYCRQRLQHFSLSLSL
ncbi:Methyltransferase domain-containing protein [Andreprevotia lacus DSM 23236]|jgi:SAM-dependent methyltransferase|uniref:Methyltransferase domain-containing protein n=1 Tax=Andreprevotia lacus DSM 23236 TaxID=1121001 RepID=A0A1W1XYG3_9NEIS|nr:methyltransferase domain-containing protein [Andreprevotia lacus]SMC28956.1 Methyltransferase domain-containing protein [Andreprevotia lacus DSM 23236]